MRRFLLPLFTKQTDKEVRIIKRNWFPLSDVDEIYSYYWNEKGDFRTDLFLSCNLVTSSL